MPSAGVFRPPRSSAMEPRAAYSESITVSVGSALPPPSPPPSPPPPPPPPLPPSLSATPRRASMSSCWSFSRCSAPHASSPMLSAPSELASGEPVTGGSLSGELAVDGALPGRIPPAVRCSFASVASAWSVLGSVRPWTALRRSKTARRGARLSFVFRASRAVRPCRSSCRALWRRRLRAKCVLR